MKYFVKDLINPVIGFLRNDNLRAYYRLCGKFAQTERFKSFSNVRFNNFTVDICDGPSFVFQYKDIFVDKIYSFLPSERPLIIDCGANIGLSVLFFKSHYPQSRIIAFEPDPSVFKILQNNVQKNFGNSDIEIHNKAVWTHSDGVGFQSDGADGGTICNSKECVLPSISLRNLLKTENTIDFLKLDIEGAEETVLTDCKDVLDKVKNIFIEFHSQFINKPKLSNIIKILEDSGFNFYLSPVNIEPQPFIKKSPNFQVNIFGFRNK